MNHIVDENTASVNFIKHKTELNCVGDFLRDSEILDDIIENLEKEDMHSESVGIVELSESEGGLLCKEIDEGNIGKIMSGGNSYYLSVLSCKKDTQPTVRLSVVTRYDKDDIDNIRRIHNDFETIEHVAQAVIGSYK